MHILAAKLKLGKIAEEATGEKGSAQVPQGSENS